MSKTTRVMAVMLSTCSELSAKLMAVLWGLLPDWSERNVDMPVHDA